MRTRIGWAGALLVAAGVAGAAGVPAREPESPAPTPTAQERALGLADDETLTAEQRRERLRALTNEAPDVADVWAAYGEALNDLGEDALALRAFEKATEIEPTLYSPWFWIGILSKRGTPEPDLARAEEAFRKALAWGAPRAQTLNELGVTLAVQGRLDESAEVWKEAIEQDPQWGVLYANLMKAAAGMDDEDLAEAYLPRALEADRFEESAVLIWGQHLLRKGDEDEAVDLYRRVIAQRPDLAVMHYYLGLALLEDGEEENAERAFREAERVAGEANEPTIRRQANFEVFRLRHPRTERDFQRTREDVFEPEGDEEDYREELEEAIGELDGIIAEHPGFWNAYSVRGVAEMRLGELEAAERDFRRVLELEPDEPNALMYLARVKQDQGSLPEAVELAEKAVEIAPRDPLFLVYTGLILVEAGHCDRAWDVYGRLLRMVGEENSALLYNELVARCGEEQGQAPASAGGRR